MINFTQEKLLLVEELFHLAGRESPVGHICFGLTVDGQLDVSRLEAALNQVIQRQTSLHSRFCRNSSVPRLERVARLQAFQNTGLFFPGLYLQSDAEPRWLALKPVGTAFTVSYIREALASEYRPTFDYDRPPLVRARLLRFGERHHLLILVLHQLVSDSWSLGVLSQSLVQAYRQAPLPLPLLPFSFKHFSDWQRRGMARGYFRDSARFWDQKWSEMERKQLWRKDLSFLQKPPMTVGQGSGCHTLTAEGPPFTNTPGEPGCSAKENVMRAGILVLSTFGVLLHLCTDRLVIPLYYTFPNRGLQGSDRVMGCFSNSHLIDLHFEGDPTFQQVVDRVVDTVRAASRHQSIPTPVLWQIRRRVPAFSDAPIFFSVLRRFQEDADHSGLRFTEALLPHVPGAEGGATLHVTVHVGEHESLMRVRYAKAFFCSELIRQMVERWKLLSIHLSARADLRMSHLKKDFA